MASSSNNSFKKFLWGFFFIALGAGLWWIATQTARFTVKRWDTTMETTVKHALTSVGVADTDVLSSLHEIRKDDKGEWVVHRMSVAIKNPSALPVMIQQLENSGASVDRLTQGSKTTLVVKHGSRIYQEIQVQPR